jgi:hypothetical protein
VFESFFEAPGKSCWGSTDEQLKNSILEAFTKESSWRFLLATRGGFSDALRQSRNIVHPYEQARSGSNFDEATWLSHEWRENLALPAAGEAWLRRNGCPLTNRIDRASRNYSSPCTKSNVDGRSSLNSVRSSIFRRLGVKRLAHMTSRQDEVDEDVNGQPKLSLSILVVIALLVGVLIGIAGYHLVMSHSSTEIEKFLDWPFIAFVGVALFVLLFFDPLAALLSRRNMRINWGKDNSIVIGDLSNELDKAVAPILERIDALEEALHKLQAESERSSWRNSSPLLAYSKLASTPEDKIPQEKTEASLLEEVKAAERTPNPAELWSTAESRKHAEKRVREALSDPKWVWRTVERLAVLAGISEGEVLDICRSQDDIVLGRAKNGQAVARLRSRSS